MERYCIKIYALEERIDILKGLGLRYLCKPDSNGIILFSNDYNDLLDACNRIGINTEDDAKDCICFANEVQLDFYEGFIEK